MRKYLTCFLAGAFLPCLAYGYDSPNGRCYAENVDNVFDYVVYFENDRPSARYADNGKDLAAVTGLDDCVAELKGKLNSIPADSYVVLIGSADRNASYEYNTGLASRRINIVKDLFLPQQQGHIVELDATKGNDSWLHGSQKGKEPKERAVRIIVKDTIEQANQAAQDFMQIYAKVNQTTTVTIKMGDTRLSAARISDLSNNIKGIANALNVSVWKNKEGNFNTSRLVSDSLAGVVLGTAGGLITSNIVKKNQIKGGFEDIKCTVGGQVVAEYDDDFVVGMN